MPSQNDTVAIVDDDRGMLSIGSRFFWERSSSLRFSFCWENIFCLGSAARRRCGPRACFFFKPFFSPATPMHMYWPTGSTHERRVTCISCFLLSSLALLAFLALNWGSPIMPGPVWKPRGSDHPIQRLILLLAVSAGLPYFVLSSTGPCSKAGYENSSRPHALPAVFSFKSWILIGSAELSISGGAVAISAQCRRGSGR